MPSLMPKGPTRVRYLILAALASGAILSYLLRVSLSSAGTTIQANLEISDSAMGNVFAAFFLGYFWFQIPGGWLGNRLGARLSLGLMGFLWAVATIVSSRSRSIPTLYWSRFALGLAQAGLFPITIMAIRDWFPRDRHGLASSVINACMSVGAVIASGLTTRLLVVFGWRETFLLYGLVTVAWACWFLAWFRNTPDRHPSVNEEERELISASPLPLEGPAVDGKTTKVSSPSILDVFLSIVGSFGMWALCSQAFFQAFAYAMIITWFPAYLQKGRGLDLTAAGDLTVLPLVTIVVGSLVGGFLIDLILKKTGRKWLSRSVLPAAGLMLGAIAIAAATLIRQPVQAVILIALGMFFMGISFPGKWACTIDLTGANSATGFAVMNMAGNVGAWACPKVVGRIFQGLEQGTGDWNSVLLLIAGVAMAGAVSCLILNPNRPAFRDSQPLRIHEQRVAS